eukprot:TRINITY_DN6319_c0_g1_i2.p1 TRINITY_DN6319_c0_g1~~TRINITY_DN6319_c0_g1_i2.p1  ORF type:complete len:460 (+),score=63.04 TRINITY_DN6319_c0_g1_i2:199-1380(+)
MAAPRRRGVASSRAPVRGLSSSLATQPQDRAFASASFCGGVGTLTPKTDAALTSGDPAILPFGDGGHDQEAQPPRIYTHGPCASEFAATFVVPCEHWSNLPVGGTARRKLAEEALKVLRANGFVVLQRLLPAEHVGELERLASQHIASLPDGVQSQPLRAGRIEVPPPFEGLWTSDWLVSNELVLQVAAQYVYNSLANGRSEEEQKWAWIEWVTEGADIDWFRKFSPSSAAARESPLSPGCSMVGLPTQEGPHLGQVSLIATPPRTQAQKRHRDIILPGPCAQLSMQVALTPLSAVNGPVAFRPASHIMETPGYEVVAVPPAGSVVLYDSFTDHRGIENQTAKTRYALYAEFETRGIFTGYASDHFGSRGGASMEAFRRHVDPSLRRWVDKLA